MNDRTSGGIAMRKLTVNERFVDRYRLIINPIVVGSG
jgi:hypothetical protein